MTAQETQGSPEWLQQLNERLVLIEERLNHTLRVAARGWNFQAFGGGGERFKYAEVPFLNGQLPSELGLPPLLSIVAIRNLEGAELERYYLGYHHHQDDDLPSVEDMREGILKAMAVNYSLKDERRFGKLQQIMTRSRVDLENRSKTLE